MGMLTLHSYEPFPFKSDLHKHIKGDVAGRELLCPSGKPWWPNVMCRDRQPTVQMLMGSPLGRKPKLPDVILRLPAGSSGTGKTSPPRYSDHGECRGRPQPAPQQGWERTYWCRHSGQPLSAVSSLRISGTSYMKWRGWSGQKINFATSYLPALVGG